MRKKNPQFEDYLLELEKVVEKLEKGNISLEKSLDEFQKGIELYKECSLILNDAEGRVTVLASSEGELEIDELKE